MVIVAGIERPFPFLAACMVDLSREHGKALALAYPAVCELCVQGEIKFGHVSHINHSARRCSSFPNARDPVLGTSSRPTACVDLGFTGVVLRQAPQQGIQ